MELTRRDGPGGSYRSKSTPWSSRTRTTHYSTDPQRSFTGPDQPTGPTQPTALELDLQETVKRLDSTTSQSRHARERSEEQLLAEARRLLLFEASGPLEPHRAAYKAERGIDAASRNVCSLLAGSGYWDPHLYLSFRKRFLEAGRFGAAAGLQAVVAEATSMALKEGMYGLPPVHAGAEPLKAHLDVFSGAHWVGLESMTGSEKSAEARQVPPLVCSPLGPLELLLKLKAIYPHHFFHLSFEATDFQDDKAGGAILSAREARSVAQQDMLLRTSLGNNFNAAARLCNGGKTPRGLLQATSDPFLFQAPKVVLFRGPAEQGYPFLPEDKQVLINVLVTGRPNVRPMLSAHGEYFGMQKDVVSHMERLQLLAQVAADRDAKQREASINPHLARRQKPVLVIAAHDLTVPGAPQPRNSIAIALKSWRQYYSELFEAVVVACGDVHTASLMDMQINKDIYASVLAGATSFVDWSWNPELLELSVNNVLRTIGDLRQTYLKDPVWRAFLSDPSLQKDPLPLAKGSPASGGVSEKKKLHPPGEAADEVTPMAVSSSRTAKPSVFGTGITGESSRSAFQRALDIRKAERIIHDPIESARKRLDKDRDNVNAERSANARVIATEFLRTFTAHKTRLEKEQMTRFDIEKRAAMFGFPKHLKHHVSKLAEVELMEGAWQARHGTSFRSTFEVPKLDSDARTLAGDLSTQLHHHHSLREVTVERQSADLPGIGRTPRQKPAKIGRHTQLAGRGVIQNLIEQHEALGAAYSS